MVVSKFTPYLDAARLITTVQRNKRARIIEWPYIKEAIDRVKNGLAFVGLDGGRVNKEYSFNAYTTLVLIAGDNKEIILGCQRVKALEGHPTPGPIKLYNEELLNRGRWHRVSGFSIDGWRAEFPCETKVCIPYD